MIIGDEPAVAIASPDLNLKSRDFGWTQIPIGLILDRWTERGDGRFMLVPARRWIPVRRGREGEGRGGDPRFLLSFPDPKMEDGRRQKKEENRQ